MREPDPSNVLKDEEVASGETETPSRALVRVAEAPLAIPTPPLSDRRRPVWKLILALILIAVVVCGGFYWWRQRQARLPAGIVSGNGRVEAQEIDIETKFAGRVAQLFVDEGDMVAPGQIVARMDVRDLEASLAKAESQVQQAQRSLDEANANVEQQKTQVTLAKQEIERTMALVTRGFATKQLLDQRQQGLTGALAALNAANARVGEAERARDAATHDVEFFKVNIADNTLVSPTIGRVQYRIANVGEVLPAGGKVFTLLDVSNVYMDVYLPTSDAGRAGVGSDARLLLDAYPTFPISAHVSFIATQAQFTPKAVETKNERDKLMFRVKVRVDPEILRAHAADVRTGLPGIAYVLVDSKVKWPAELRVPASTSSQ
nr:HlyD family efflux transporter periplasmic adaptor subunit [Methylocapsa palsarum]